jgi:hypothetical protein
MPLAARLEDLGYGYTERICKAARACPLQGIKKDEIETALGYFEANAPRMRYRWFRQCGALNSLLDRRVCVCLALSYARAPHCLTRAESLP